jgi:Uma2 family endonuclease
MTTAAPITTAEQLLQASELGPCELVRGELVMMTPAGSEHGALVVDLTLALGMYVKPAGLGMVFSADTGFQIERNPDTVRSPDVAFVRADRVGVIPKGFFPGAPDLAVEVVSPTDRAREVTAKAQYWLRCGCGAVWVVDPATKTVAVYLPDREPAVLRMGDELSGGDVVPGFTLPVARIFSR